MLKRRAVNSTSLLRCSDPRNAPESEPRGSELFTFLDLPMPFFHPRQGHLCKRKQQASWVTLPAAAQG